MSFNIDDLLTYANYTHFGQLAKGGIPEAVDAASDATQEAQNLTNTGTTS